MSDYKRPDDGNSPNIARNSSFLRKNGFSKRNIELFRLLLGAQHTREREKIQRVPPHLNSRYPDFFAARAEQSELKSRQIAPVFPLKAVDESAVFTPKTRKFPPFALFNK